MLKRKKYLESPLKGKAIWVQAYYSGRLTREEIINISGASDNYTHWYQRTSRDNGKTWSEMKEIDALSTNTPAGGIARYPQNIIYDCERNSKLQFSMLRLFSGTAAFDFSAGESYFDHVFVSENDKAPELLRYESGGDFDPENPFDTDFMHNNRAYFGVNPAIATLSTQDIKDGTVYFPLCGIPHPENKKDSGIILMRKEPGNAQWFASNAVFIDPELSSRGLLEPSVAVLDDGRILIICRGSNTANTPGRKWFCTSEDGGRTLSPVRELAYDDGSKFYSPSSIHRLIRSRKNGKLYWIANITDSPPDGNSPRYPLCLTQIDESIPAVKKDSCVIIDDRHAGEPENLQLSNFSVLEDRQTMNIEILMTRWGENPSNKWDAKSYKYVYEVK